MFNPSTDSTSFNGMKLDDHILTQHQYNQHMYSSQYSPSSGSTPSLPLSIPYYYIANHTDSFDTVHMLNSFSNNRPQYSNTSHLNLNLNAAQGEMAASSPSNLKPPLLPSKPNAKTNHIKLNQPVLPPTKIQPQAHPQARAKATATHRKEPEYSGEDLFNQVPKRFSQFILDQQNPYMVQRLDHLSMNLISLYSGGTPSYMNHGKAQKKSNTTGTMSVTQSQKNTSTTNSDSHIRQILDSMGSQATIFSTRLHDVKSETSSELQRKKAIKAKNGLLYRIRARFQRFGRKMKKIFTVKRRKTVKPIGPASQRRRNTILKSVKANGTKLVRAGTFTRKGSSYHISAPVQNQDLSLGSDDRALEMVPMDSKLKYRAGLQFIDENELPDIPDENDSIKRKTLSPPAIIPSLNPLTAAGKFAPPSASLAPAKMPQQTLDFSNQVERDPKPQPTMDPSAMGLKSPLATEETVVDASSSKMERKKSAKHRKSFNAPVIDETLEEELVDKWKQYLLQVISSRIKLRQEINFYQSLRKELNYSFGLDTDEGSLVSSVYVDTSRAKAAAEAAEAARKPSTTSTTSARSKTTTSTPSTTIPHEEIVGAARSRHSSTRKLTISSSPGIRHSLLVQTVATQASASYESDDEFAISIFDPTTEKFNQSFAQRHSVLGEMLDYESDTTSVASSSTNTSRFSSSRSHSNGSPRRGAGGAHEQESHRGGALISDEDLGIGKKYGTVIRRTSPSKRSGMSSTTHLLAELSDRLTFSIKRESISSQESLRRSPGLKMGLSSVASSGDY